MASYLLDTHTLIWCSEGNENLSPKVAKIIASPENQIFVSIASFWEICIKLSIGKLRTKIPIEQLEIYLTENNILILPIKILHTLIVKDLVKVHRDPFDRMLIAQAISENLIILSKDTNFAAYENVTTIW